MLILLCICISLYMLLSIDLLTHYLHRTGWQRFISTFLLFYSQIIGTEFMLGLFSALSGYNLVALNFLLSTCIVLAVQKKSGKKNRGVLTNYWASIRNSVASSKNALLKDPFWSALLVLAFVFVGWIIFLGIIFPDLDYDGNSYHLTFVGDMVQNKTFIDPPTSLSYLAGYPKGGEFIQAWSVLVTKNDMLTDLTQIPFLILAVCALYAVALRIGANKKQARFSATLFVFLPIVLNQLKTSYVDVILCSLFFAGLAIVIQKKLSKLDLLLVGIIFSLLISVKSTGFLFVLALLPFLLWNLYQNYGKAIRNYLHPLILILLPAFFGLYWYIKNYILYGSPIYPFGFKLAGLTIFPGKTFQELAATAIQSTSLPHGCAQRIWFVWTEQKDWFGCLYNYDTNYAGLGPIWFIILIPAALISVYLAVKKRNAIYLAITAMIVALFAIYPINYYSRYTMFITAVGVFALSLTLTYIKIGAGNMVKFLAIVLAVSVIATNFVLCNYPPQVVKAQFKSILSGSKRGEIYSSFPGKAFVVIEDKVRPGDIVDYDSKPFFIYPLWTSNFSDHVIYVPAPNRTEWYKDVHNKSVDYVFTTLGSRENSWAKNGMKSIYKDAMYEIFQTN